MSALSGAALAGMVEEATADADDPADAVMGFYTTIEERLDIPFQTCVLGVQVTVSSIDLSGGQVVAICTRGQWQQSIPIIDLPLPEPPPSGAEWIDAYRFWLG